MNNLKGKDIRINNEIVKTFRIEQQIKMFEVVQNSPDYKGAKLFVFDDEGVIYRQVAMFDGEFKNFDVRIELGDEYES